MKSKLIILLLVLFSGVTMAQTDEEPALWSHEVESLGNGEYQLVFSADIAPGWHIYSQFTAEGGSLPSEFTYTKAGTDYELLGTTGESKTIKEFSEIFEVEETFFKEKAVFTQKIRLLDPQVRQLEVELFYQICKEVCIPKEVVFQIALDGGAVVTETVTIDQRSAELSKGLRLNLKNKERLQAGAQISGNANPSLWGIFVLGFLGGLIALLTPCVFPMIPLTVSFFTKQSGNRTKGVWNGILYGFFIVLIYFLLSIPFHLFDSVDSQILNTIATNIWLNVFFFLIFVFFAFSFFGYYELTLPSSWGNKMDAISTRAGGGLGIFFMAVTLAIVSFSCTGPILGGLLGGTALAEGNVATNLSAGMTGFGVALALPFALFAVFPSLLSSLPKSGSWMNTVKVVLGFLELALAFKFLSNADLVGNWGIFKREIFLGIWILLFLLMSLYLFGLFRFKDEGPKRKLTATRLGFAMISLGFTVYLILGLSNYGNLKLLSGFPPPDFYSLTDKESDCPLGINCFKDFEEGLEYARAVNKPILLDFTGWACVNCRKMEENVWSVPEVFSILNEDYVLISLYIDDRKPLPEDQQFLFQFDSGRVKTIETVGEKWGTFQTLNFSTASQPYYVQLSPDLEVLNASIQNTDSNSYREWLESGLAQFRKGSTEESLSIANPF
ncbi:protein-disulfide reductase DsbD family protein [Lentiprolixibacter aurantiacus]|uniref:Protein-disulfide reductase DsbD family protein n=1 Tax=Lentiprolixibacter aurantiacus TaxID=2993939 RepID=A0AAE3SPS0_9FLAO|nr:cytochrome c biogenesis protein CcdA [Lentiprolixibacter aurantiacus]MCX2719732.1 protein-disulfide reductase DsbD family protein [Lentiprolixibacter aurantiacus]